MAYREFEATSNTIAARQAAAVRQEEALRMARMGCWTLEIEAGEFTFDDTYLALHRTTAEAVGGGRMPIERFVREFVHPDDAHLPLAAVAAATAAVDPAFEYQQEARILCADGAVRMVTVWFRIEKDAAGKTIRLHGVNQDVTERKRSEDDRERLRAQLLQAQKMESVGRLAGGVAHDFNNMLQAITGNVELALDEPDAAGNVRDHLLEIQRVAQRSAELTRQLLAFARRQTVVPRAVNLNDEISGVLRMLRRLIGEDIDFAWEPGGGLWSTKVDPSQIDQVLANLVVNARDAITGPGRITLSTENVALDGGFCAERSWATPGDYVRLSVRDSGAGMSPDVLAHLFEPFFTTKELGKGTGLGLATVYGIVKQNGGIIDVDSCAGHGTHIAVFLPRCAAAAPLPAEERPGRGEAGGHETLLVVEDDETVLALTRVGLERKGYQVLTVRTPATAIDAAQTYTGDIHLLITDVVMPEMNGRELAERLGQIRPGLRALFMSGYSINVAGTGGMLDEGMPFISKPFSAAALAGKVRDALDA